MCAAVCLVDRRRVSLGHITQRSVGQLNTVLPMVYT